MLYKDYNDDGEVVADNMVLEAVPNNRETCVCVQMFRVRAGDRTHRRMSCSPPTPAGPEQGAKKEPRLPGVVPSG